MKKICSLLLVLVMVISMLASCTHIKGDDNKGAVFDVYLGSEIRNFDPAFAYNDKNAVNVISLLFEGLTRINSNGKWEKALMKDYDIVEDEEKGIYKLEIELKETRWSNNAIVQASHFAYAIRRILSPELNSPAASMLFDIKNAKDAKMGIVSIDDIGVSAPNTYLLVIEFDHKIDYDEFMYTLASPALFPLYDNKVTSYPDTWATSSLDFVSNGPFTIKSMKTEDKIKTNSDRTIVLQRNAFYYISKDDALDKYVIPHIINLRYDVNVNEVESLYNLKQLFYVSDFNPANAGNYKKVNVENALSTFSYYFNTNDAVLADADVRKALSIALDRNQMATLAGGYTSAATALVPDGVFNTSRKNSFRELGGDILSATADPATAQSLVQGKNGKTITITYKRDNTNFSAGYLSKAEKIVEYTKGVWEGLGFTVNLRPLSYLEYEAAYKAGDFQVLALDVIALYANDAFGMLAPYAVNYSGNVEMQDGAFVNVPGITGYTSEAYNTLIDNAFNAETKEKRAEILHEAEKLLINDAPVVPLVFNAYYSVSQELKDVEYNYFGFVSFKEAILKNYLDYLPKAE